MAAARRASDRAVPPAAACRAAEVKPLCGGREREARKLGNKAAACQTCGSERACVRIELRFELMLAAGDKPPFGTMPVLNLTPLPVRCWVTQTLPADGIPLPAARQPHRGLSHVVGAFWRAAHRAQRWQCRVGPCGLRPPGAATAAGGGEELSLGCGSAVCQSTQSVAVC